VENQWIDPRSIQGIERFWVIHGAAHLFRAAREQAVSGVI
jgi:hypothetical protein